MSRQPNADIRFLSYGDSDEPAVPRQLKPIELDKDRVTELERNQERPNDHD